jgi:hypothetical protein
MTVKKSMAEVKKFSGYENAARFSFCEKNDGRIAATPLVTLKAQQQGCGKEWGLRFLHPQDLIFHSPRPLAKTPNSSNTMTMGRQQISQS